ncbi:cupredoxin domain-containing protein [Paenibacillus sp. JX-17]|uniref:Cupredoxin domain-containing protein n=1 Tax=Paenibacillus lacisoli TaxID=3064525 RepID=A0ABT9CEV9_9BACL|nr:cupredoxin domain-containing protein [Paenibacillus sp. JX-17]MDO7907405.1 cupredoxin domain-containing protein [Paenibacillus sp. JX-17]
MRKWLIVLISCMLFAVLAACAQKEAASSNDTASSQGVTDTGAAPSEELIIKASDYQFDQPEYHLKKGVPVKVVLQNESGEHGVIVTGLDLQLDSSQSSKVITPDKAGEYVMHCSVFCGSGHNAMAAKIIVDDN